MDLNYPSSEGIKIEKKALAKLKKGESKKRTRSKRQTQSPQVSSKTPSHISPNKHRPHSTHLSEKETKTSLVSHVGVFTKVSITQDTIEQPVLIQNLGSMKITAISNAPHAITIYREISKITHLD